MNHASDVVVADGRGRGRGRGRDGARRRRRVRVRVRVRVRGGAAGGPRASTTGAASARETREVKRVYIFMITKRR